MALATWKYQAATPTYLAFLVAGQSNAVGRGETFDGVLDAPSDFVWQISQGLQLIQAEEPLDHFDPEASDVGFGLAFGKAVYAATGIPALLIPTAQGSTGFANNNWNQGNARYNAAVNRVNFVLKAFPGALFCGVSWHQGEQSDSAGWTGAQHETALDAMIEAKREDILAPSDFPFMLGGLSPEWYTGDASREEIQAVIADTPNRLSNCYYVSSDDLTGNVGDEIHLDAASQRILGQRYATSWLATPLGLSLTV